MHPRTAVLPSFPQKNDALRQHPQHRIAALLLAKHADYNSLEKKKKLCKLQGVSPEFSGKQNRKKTPKKQIGKVEGKGEMEGW